VTRPPFPPDDFAIQVLLPAARNAQLIPGAEAEPDYSTTSLPKFVSRGRPFPLSDTGADVNSYLILQYARLIFGICLLVFRRLGLSRNWTPALSCA
jgi:hypothetical protein